MQFTGQTAVADAVKFPVPRMIAVSGRQPDFKIDRWSDPSAHAAERHGDGRLSKRHFRRLPTGLINRFDGRYRHSRKFQVFQGFARQRGGLRCLGGNHPAKYRDHAH